MITKFYPSIDKAHIKAVENALCPFKVKLPKQLGETINKVCSDFLELKKEISKEISKESCEAWEDSVLNSLDFHYSDEKLKIIEANTNASGYLISHLCPQPEADIKSFEDSLFKSFSQQFGGDGFKEIYIIDKNPTSEKMYPEFLMYKDFFRRFGVEAKILETSKLHEHLSNKTFVYNRDTDFYFEQHPDLLQAWKNKRLILTSSPLSYNNIASKTVSETESRLLKTPKYAFLKEHSLETLNFHADLWSRRKSLFFKPSSSFGSKGVYAGKSVSRKKFDSLGEEQDYLAQELHPPGKVLNGDTEWKFDIRAYFSQGPVQKVLARVYNGQLTNFSQTGGGFALIDWLG